MTTPAGIPLLSPPAGPVWDVLSTASLANLMFIVAALLLSAVAAVRLSNRTGLPSLLLYLLMGLVLGEAGIGIHFEDMALSRFLGYAALAFILAEGGLTTSWADIRRSVGPAAVLSTVGVAVSIAVTGLAAHLVFGWSVPVSLLVAAILASTDAAAVFSVLRRVPLPPRLSGMLEAESGFNDAPVVLMVVALSQWAAHADAPQEWGPVLGSIAVELVGGAGIGLVIGYTAAQLMRRAVTSAAGLFPLAVTAWCMLAYGTAASLHTSGFLSVYLAGLVLGNSGLPQRAAYRGFAQSLGWLAQIGLFVMLGLLASPDQLLPQVVPALVLGSVLLLVARPLSVWMSTVWWRTGWRDQVFLSWAGLRGAVPIVLATVPELTGVPGIRWVFDLVFVLVVVFTLVQGPTLPWVARRLRVSDEGRADELDVEVTPLEDMGASLMTVRIGASSRLHGMEVFELRLPTGADVTLVAREGSAFVPDRDTMLLSGDQVLVMATSSAREKTVQRLHLLDAHGRLGRWRSPGGRHPIMREHPGHTDR